MIFVKDVYREMGHLMKFANKQSNYSDLDTDVRDL